ncbi:hypothetical protein [Planktotalea sp.]|uniref:hypothetical protein n=1 Tax=Planktotalea sp. TaxID=2029877 RepID=UPI003D6B434C
MITRFILTLTLPIFLIGCASDTKTKEVVICQGTCASESEAEPEEETHITLPASNKFVGGISRAEFDAASGVFTVTGAGLNAQMKRFPVADHKSFLAMRDGVGLHNAYHAKGSGTQLVIYSGGLAGSVVNLAGFTRTGTSEMPLTGSARYTGEYAGFTTTRRINGSARIDVSFDDNTVSGRITNREFRQRPDNVLDSANSLSDLSLEETKLNRDGSFKGVTGGGKIINGQEVWDPAIGRFVGLIGGAEGNEVVGSVAVSHRSPSGADFDEVGGFLASH